MSDQQALYAEVKPDIEAVSLPLFEMSKKFIAQQGDFLPHAVALTSERKIELVGAAGEEDVTTPAAILPILHAGLREMARTKSLIAIGVAESVIITPQGKANTPAIKVLFEHRRGITVALYQPYAKTLFKRIYGEVFATLGKSEVNAWQPSVNPGPDVRLL
jgi:hypothetical protein